MSQRELPSPEDDSDRKLLAKIAEYGWMVLGIQADIEAPDYAFSIGLFHTLDHPEVLLMGLDHKIAQRLINDMGAAIRGGQKYEAGQRYEEIAEGFPLAFVAVEDRYYREYVGYARWFYHGSDFPLLQCVWPDKQGVFPWEEGYDARFFQAQRVLGPAGRWAHGWPFAAPPNVAIFVMRAIVEESKPILRVARNEKDGAWEFLTGGPIGRDLPLVVALEEVVRRDPSLLDLGNLPPGWRAWREGPGAPWQREAKEKEAEEEKNGA